MLFSKTRLALDRIGADAETCCASLLNLDVEVPEVTTFFGATACKGTGIKEKHYRTAAQLLRKSDYPAVVIRQFEVCCDVANSHLASIQPCSSGVQDINRGSCFVTDRDGEMKSMIGP